MGHGMARTVASTAGSGLDRLFGTNKAPTVLQAQAAARLLKQAGIATGDDSNSQLPSALILHGGHQEIDPGQLPPATLGTGHAAL
jgi:hypothetical protein